MNTNRIQILFNMYINSRNSVVFHFQKAACLLSGRLLHYIATIEMIHLMYCYIVI
jgi:hypothetical protein